MLAGITLAAHGELHAVGHTGRNLHAYYLFTVYDAFASTLLALVLDDFTLATASGTGGTGLHGAQNGLLVADHTSTALASRTGLHAAIAFGTCTVTMLACHIFLQLELLFHTSGYLFQIQLHLHAQVTSTKDPLLCASSSKASEATETSAMSAKDVTKHGEDVIHRHATSTESAKRSAIACSSAHAGMSKLVIPCPFIGIAQYVIRLCGFLKLLFGLLVTGILVRVVLDGLLPVGFLYLIGRGVLLDSQHFVVISLFHIRICLLWVVIILLLPLWRGGLLFHSGYIRSVHNPESCPSVPPTVPESQQWPRESRCPAASPLYRWLSHRFVPAQ